MQALPERGQIGIFNRSYYEDVLIVRVHPELLQTEGLTLGDDDGFLEGALSLHSRLRTAPRRQ